MKMKKKRYKKVKIKNNNINDKFLLYISLNLMNIYYIEKILNIIK